jgi:hypothetical protein
MGHHGIYVIEDGSIDNQSRRKSTKRNQGTVLPWTERKCDNRPPENAMQVEGPGVLPGAFLDASDPVRKCRFRISVVIGCAHSQVKITIVAARAIAHRCARYDLKSLQWRTGARLVFRPFVGSLNRSGAEAEEWLQSAGSGPRGRPVTKREGTSP